MEENLESKIFAVKTSIGEEENAAEMVYARADYKGLPLWAKELVGELVLLKVRQALRQ